MGAGGEEKTEEPTAKKKGDARKKGNIAKSKDLDAALLLLAAITILKYAGPYMSEKMVQFFHKLVVEDMPTLQIPEGKEVIPYVTDYFMWLGLLAGPFLGALFVAAYVVGYIQVGWLITFAPLKFNLNKLSPISGFKRLFNVKNMVMLVMNMAKLAIMMPVAYYTVWGELQNVITMVEMEAEGTFVHMTDKVLNLAQTLAVLLMSLGIADYYYQKYKHNKDMKMTKQEIKEEFKQMEGDPKVKQKRRQKQMEIAMSRMMQEVPQAEVVVRNPTHFAVAISYKTGMPAPVVIAKGMDKIAEKIIEIAREARVPMVENPPLARELYKKVEVGQEIPEELFAAVAEILTSVMSSDKKRQMMESMAAGNAA